MNDLEKSNIEEITKLHYEICGSLKLTIDKAIQIGKLLIEQKEKLKHGNFLPWIKNNLPFSDRTARNYMKIFENKEKLKMESVSNLNDAYKQLEDLRENKKDKEEKLINRMQRLEKERKSLMVLLQTNNSPEKKYQLIYMNPPWEKVESEIIFDLNIKEISDKNCALYIWLPVDELPLNEIKESYGFDYKTSLVWDLLKSFEKPEYWYEKQCMQLAIFAKGKGNLPMYIKEDKFTNLIKIEGDNPYRKPEKFREILERQHTYKTKLMIFSDKSYSEWDVWNPF